MISYFLDKYYKIKAFLLKDNQNVLEIISILTVILGINTMVICITSNTVVAFGLLLVTLGLLLNYVIYKIRKDKK